MTSSLRLMVIGLRAGLSGAVAVGVVLALAVAGGVSAEQTASLGAEPAAAAAGTATALESLEPAPEGLDARAIAERAEDVLRSERTVLEARMTVVSPRLTAPREVGFLSWDDRAGKRSFIRISAPAKDAGMGFLKLPPNLWMFVPRVERTMRIPPSMMLQPWMGSDFTNDDLVKESSAIDDYDHRLLGVDPAPIGVAGEPLAEGIRAYVVEYRPHEDAAVVWGRIVTWIETQHSTPLRQDFYDEDGALLRTMRFGDVRDVGGRHVPHLWTMRPLDKQGHETRVEIERFEFDADIPDSVFTKRHLKQRK